VAAHQAASGQEAGADDTLGRIEFSTALTSALQNIASVYMERDDVERAVAYLERAETAAGAIEHDEERIRTLCEIGNQYVEAGRSELAMASFENARMTAEGLQSSQKDHMLVSCAVGFLQAGNSEMADSVLDLVLDKTQLSSALVSFARYAWKNDEKEDALEALDEAYEIINAQKEKETRDSRNRYAIMAAIAAQFAVFSHGERAVEIAVANPSPADRSAALSQIAQLQVMQNNDEAAHETVALIDDDAERMLALISMADAKKRLGDTEAYSRYLAEAASISDTIPQFVARAKVLTELTSRRLADDSQEEARQSGLQCLEVIGEIRDESSKAEVLAALSKVYGEGNLEIGTAEKSILARIVRRM
jgi:tetratricopeptide (TPR) repeat protein